MKLVLTAFGKNCSPWMVHIWQKYYKNSGCDIPAVLFCDADLTQSVRDIWDYEIVQCDNTINISLAVNTINNDMIYADIFRLLAYRYIGSCIVSDYDSILLKDISINDIPVCDFGLVQKSDISHTIKSCGQPIPHRIFEEFTYVDECYSAPVIFRKDYFDLYMDKFYKYINKFYDLPGGPIQYCESILCLVHKLSNGVYLQPEWNWIHDSTIQNDDIIFKHYAFNSGKQKLMHSEENIPKVDIS